MALLHFTKMEGLGNDFIVLEQTPPLKKMTARFARKLCDRRFGIGADQILLLQKAKKGAHCRMEIWNQDGSRAEMCGNGIRAVAFYLKDGTRKLKVKKGLKESRIDTDAGLKTVQILKKGKGEQVRVDMGPPQMGRGFSTGGEAIEARGAAFQYFEVSMGNPHAVIFVPTLRGVPVEEVGPLLEQDPRFPNRTNVEFVEVKGDRVAQVSVWERGAGITLACGTGACAVGVASIATKRIKTPAAIDLPGGRLEIEWSGSEDSPVYMTGPARESYRGQLDLNDPYWKAD